MTCGLLKSMFITNKTDIPPNYKLLGTFWESDSNDRGGEIYSEQEIKQKLGRKFNNLTQEDLKQCENYAINSTFMTNIANCYFQTLKIKLSAKNDPKYLLLNFLKYEIYVPK